jgi:hypothetical protein
MIEKRRKRFIEWETKKRVQLGDAVFFQKYIKRYDSNGFKVYILYPIGLVIWMYQLVQLWKRSFHEAPLLTDVGNVILTLFYLIALIEYFVYLFCDRKIFEERVWQWVKEKDRLDRLSLSSNQIHDQEAKTSDQ